MCACPRQADTVRNKHGIDVKSSVIYRAFRKSVEDGTRQFSTAPSEKLASLITPVTSILLSPDVLQPAKPDTPHRSCPPGFARERRRLTRRPAGASPPATRSSKASACSSAGRGAARGGADS